MGGIFDFFMLSSGYEMQGRASYRYQVFYIEDGSIVTIDEGEASFVTSAEETGASKEELYAEGELFREDAVHEYKEKMLPWIKNGIILVSLDIEHFEKQLQMSTHERVCPTSEYFDLVWAREDAL